jgi:hypothetical protein
MSTMMKAGKPKTKANNVRLQPKAMTTEALALHIQNETVGVLRRVSELRPFYIELWARFEKLPKGGKIMGCSTRTEFARNILHRSMKSIQFAMYGRHGPALHERQAGLTDVIDGMKNDAEDRENARLEKEGEREEARQMARDRQAEARQEERDRQRASQPTTSTADTPPAEDLREFANLGRRAAAAKYHPDRAGENQRIRELNDVADWLETVASNEQ